MVEVGAVERGWGVRVLDILGRLAACDEDGCVVAFKACAEYSEWDPTRCLEYRVDTVEYGRPTRARVEVANALRDLAEKLARLESVRHTFREGKASLRDLERAYKEWRKAAKTWEHITRKAQAKLDMLLSDTEEDDEPSPCERLVQAINAVVDHPEEGW